MRCENQRRRWLVTKATAESVVGERDLGGLRALVTGAGSGLGAEIARVLALRGATVWTGCRSLDKSASFAEVVRARHGAEVAGRLVAFPYDGEDVAAVRARTDALVAAGTRFDAVFLNAGTFAQPFRLTPEGHEATFAGNLLGHFALVHRLLAGRGFAPEARVVATLSEGVTANPFARADLDMLEHPRPALHSMHGSPHTKVLLALVLTELSRRVRGTELEGLRCAGVVPAATLTNNIHTGGALRRLAGRIVGPLFFRSIEEGTAPLLWAALDAQLPEDASLVGAVGRIEPLPLRCRYAAMAARTWEVAERVLDLPV
jgi:NAD(P)-dependent dehydrogenase (short-subunit alcohol dehydrogenase family)